MSLELFISTYDSPQHVYTSVKKIFGRRCPESGLLSLEKVKQLVVEITGVSLITDHMCINSCVAYTGPFKALEACPVCGEGRFDSQHQPKQVFSTIPVGPQLQALTRNKDKVMALRYRILHTEAILLELRNNEGFLKHYTDFFDGSQYLEAIGEGLIKEDDIILMLSGWHTAVSIKAFRLLDVHLGCSQSFPRYTLPKTFCPSRVRYSRAECSSKHGFLHVPESTTSRSAPEERSSFMGCFKKSYCNL